jgi:AMP nucleosidase
MVPEGVKTEASDAKVSSQFVDSHIEIGIETLNEIKDHGQSVRHLKF